MEAEEIDAEVTAEQVEAVMTERHVALGMVLDMAGSMEWTLGAAFCSLMASKFAIIVAGGQGADWLIGRCRELVKVHHEMTEAQRTAILAALDDCAQANVSRNTLVHAMKSASTVPGGRLITVKSKRGRHLPVTESWTPVAIREVAAKLAIASTQLHHAMELAVSPQMMVIDQALAWEDQRRAEHG